MPTGDETIGLFARCFIAAVIAFLVFSPFYREWGRYSSWWDAIAGRKVVRILKILIFIEVARNIWLLYQVIVWGNPVHGYVRDIHFYWTFGYIRPILGILSMIVGFVAEMHPAFRVTCVVGCLTQAPFDFFSAFLLGEYIIQVEDHNAKTGEYNTRTMLEYYWCDVVSFGLCIWMALLALHLCCIAGFVTAPYVSYQAISGGQTDRLSILEEERDKRMIYDSVQADRYDALSKHAREEKLKRKNQKQPNGDLMYRGGLADQEDIAFHHV